MIIGERTAEAVNPRDAPEYETDYGIFINYGGDSWGGQACLHYSAAVILFYDLTDVLFNYRDRGRHWESHIDVWRDERRPETINFNVDPVHDIYGTGFMHHMTPEDAREFWITLMVAISRIDQRDLPPPRKPEPPSRRKVIWLQEFMNKRWLS